MTLLAYVFVGCVVCYLWLCWSVEASERAYYQRRAEHWYAVANGLSLPETRNPRGKRP